MALSLAACQDIPEPSNCGAALVPSGRLQLDRVGLVREFGTFVDGSQISTNQNL